MNNNEAVNWIINISSDIGKTEHRDLWHYEQALAEIKEMLETAQPEVVRCKDCKFYEVAWLKKDGTDDNRYKPSICVKGQYGIARKPDWFCADAERRTDG